MQKVKVNRGFSLIELMVVVIIVGILASVSIPLMQAKVQKAKWSEASAMAGAVRRAVRAAYAENPDTIGVWSNQPVESVLSILKFGPEDLTGRYFSASDFMIVSINSDGNAVISVSAPEDLSGSGLLNQDGWQYIP